MIVEGKLSRKKGRYAAETRRRMALCTDELAGLRRVAGGDTGRLWTWIRDQERASRAAGFDRVARLCQTAKECLEGLRAGEQPVLTTMAATLAEVCRAIQLHAEAVATAAGRAARAATRTRSPRVVPQRTARGGDASASRPGRTSARFKL